jgi:hypothetical protein
MKRPLIAVILLLVLQTTSRALQTGGSLEGTVVASGTNEPLAGARVTLNAVTTPAAAGSANSVVSGAIGMLPADAAVLSVPSNSPSSIPSVTTDRDGRFAFQNLSAGLYSLHVLRNGYARQSYGQRTPGGPATAIRLAAGQSLKNAVIALVPAGNVSGAVRGSDGQPQAGVPIQLLRATFNSSGQRTFQVEGTARTNDRGEYRLYWITPGRYYISAGTAAGPNRSLNPNSAAGSPNEIPDRSFALTFYPGVWDARGAALIDISPGGELNGIDFNVAGQQLLRVRGRIVDAATGQPPHAVGLSLAYRTLSGASGAFSSGEKYDARTGEFELRNVPPGVYVLQAIASDRAPAAEGETVLRIAPLAIQPNARVPVEVSNTDLDGILLTLTAGVAIPGRISVDGMPLTSISGWDKIRVPLKPTLDSAFGPNLQPAAPVPQAPGVDGSFTIAGVSPGEFNVGPITGLPAGFYIKEARFNQTDVLSQPLRFSGVASSPLEIVLSSKAGQLDGTVVDGRSAAASGARLVLVPDRQRGRTDLYKTTLSDSSGRFVFRNIPPGDYRIFAWEALESYAYFDPDLLRRVESQSSPVRVAESAANSVAVRIISGNQ